MSTSLPHRSNTNEAAVPDDDSTETTKLFDERLKAWHHAISYLEDYVKATEKLESGLGKDYEKVLKSINSPLKEGHQFQQQNGGLAEMFENIRTNTQGISNNHHETAKTLKGTVLPVFERLSSEVKNKQKELDKGAGKASKNVEKARKDTQKHVDLLGQHTSNHDSRGAAVKSTEDPYLLQRQVYHRLNKQVAEENNNRDDILAVQNDFQRFEAHIIQSISQGIAHLNSVMSNSSDQQRNMYGDMTAKAQRIPPDFEWQGFLQRNNHVLIDPNGPKRSLNNISFPNQDHPSTRPLIAGSLERKSKLLKKYEAGYYVVTPSKYLHSFKSDDDFSTDPSPENSLYLPDCLIGAVDGSKFNVKGKDSSKGVMSKLSTSHEYAFQAHTPDDARKWHDVIQSVSAGATNSAPTSPVAERRETMHSDQGTTSTGSVGPEKPEEAPMSGIAERRREEDEKNYAPL